MPLHHATILPSSRGDYPEAGQTVSISQLTNDDWNAAFEDENGVAITPSAADLNTLDGAGTPVFAATSLGFVRVAQAVFDAEIAENRPVDAYGLGITIPANSLIIGGGYDVLKTFTTASADSGTIAIHAQAANDLVTATAVSAGGDIWDQGRRSIIPVMTGATAVKTTTAKEVTVTVGGQALTAGTMNVWVIYIPGQANTA